MKTIWDNDKSQDKHKATQELIYIYHMSEPKSVYAKLDASMREQTIIDDYIADKKWKPSKEVQNAIEKYKRLIETPITRAFQSISIALDKLNKTLEKMDAADAREMTQIGATIEKYEKYAQSYMKLKEISEKELETTRKIKGGVRPSNILND
jgi:hypothetical protein